MFNFFGNKQECCTNQPIPVVDDARIARNELETVKHSHALELSDIRSKHTLELREKDFEMKHLADERVKAAESSLADALKKVAVLEKENEMLGKITDLNADIIDVKSLVSKVVDKLPEIKLSSLSVKSDN